MIIKFNGRLSNQKCLSLYLMMDVDFKIYTLLFTPISTSLSIKFSLLIESAQQGLDILVISSINIFIPFLHFIKQFSCIIGVWCWNCFMKYFCNMVLIFLLVLAWLTSFNKKEDKFLFVPVRWTLLAEVSKILRPHLPDKHIKKVLLLLL